MDAASIVGAPPSADEEENDGVWGAALRTKHLRETMGLFDEQDLMDLLGLKKETLAAWRGDKIGPDYVKLGKAVFYRKADVNEWIARCVVVTKRTAK